MKARLVDTGGDVVTGSPAAFKNILAEEIEKWAKVVKASGTRPQ